ncbi:hypothetical protein [Oricola thermophila]|uniref:Uncharacterized protein n=1 Tax=Oricola thermophila TaxID=2742145 RepID=A0A6N1VKE7_9HYPH|nr:hypothetical protein [Oricola thermophila]QKV20225.1 hypothetical protein HTY61_18100 [Oricola thermophila]
MFDRIVAAIAFAAGVTAGIGLFSLYDISIDDPGVRREARAGYVARAEMIALEAELEELRRQRDAIAAWRDRYAVALARAEKERADLERIRESERVNYAGELERAGRACLLDRTDIDWLRRGE